MCPIIYVLFDTNYTGRSKIPEGWVALEHPEGKLYYRHPNKVNIKEVTWEERVEIYWFLRPQRILTHTDISVPSNLSDVEHIYQKIQAALLTYGDLPTDLELVLDSQQHEEKTEYSYYLASWESGVILWIEEVSIWFLTCYHRQVYCKAHLSEQCLTLLLSLHYNVFSEHALDWQFWWDIKWCTWRVP